MRHSSDSADWIPPAKLRALTVEQVLNYAGICRPRFYAEVRAGRLIARKIGRRTFVLASDLEQYLASRPMLKLDEAAA